MTDAQPPDESVPASVPALSDIGIGGTDVAAREHCELSLQQRQGHGSNPGQQGRHHGLVGDLAPILQWWASTRASWPAPAVNLPVCALFGEQGITPGSISAEAGIIAAQTHIEQRITSIARPDDDDERIGDAGSVTSWLLTGAEVADRAIDAGADLLICADIADSDALPATAIIGLLSSSTPAELMGFSDSTITDEMWMTECANVRELMRQGRAKRGDGAQLLAAIGTPSIAAMTGFLLQAARRRTGVLLDGSASLAAALIAHRTAHRAKQWWLPGHLGTQPAQAQAMHRLGLEPAVPVRLGPGEGRGAMMVVALLRTSLEALRSGHDASPDSAD